MLVWNASILAFASKHPLWHWQSEPIISLTDFTGIINPVEQHNTAVILITSRITHLDTNRKNVDATFLWHIIQWFSKQWWNWCTNTYALCLFSHMKNRSSSGVKTQLIRQTFSIFFSCACSISAFAESEKYKQDLGNQTKAEDKLLKILTLIPKQVNSSRELEISGQRALWITSSSTEPETKPLFHFNWAPRMMCCYCVDYRKAKVSHTGRCQISWELLRFGEAYFSFFWQAHLRMSWILVTFPSLLVWIYKLPLHILANLRVIPQKAMMQIISFYFMTLLCMWLQQGAVEGGRHCSQALTQRKICCQILPALSMYVSGNFKPINHKKTLIFHICCSVLYSYDDVTEVYLECYVSLCQLYIQQF